MINSAWYDASNVMIVILNLINTTRKALLHDQRFLDWKRGVRGEGYAWSHRYCNREKNAYSTIKLTRSIEYVIT